MELVLDLKKRYSYADYLTWMDVKWHELIGSHFGKKWKHAARTAMQRLKKTEKVKLINGKWTLIK